MLPGQPRKHWSESTFATKETFCAPTPFPVAIFYRVRYTRVSDNLQHSAFPRARRERAVKTRPCRRKPFSRFSRGRSCRHASPRICAINGRKWHFLAEVPRKLRPYVYNPLCATFLPSLRKRPGACESRWQIPIAGEIGRKINGCDTALCNAALVALVLYVPAAINCKIAHSERGLKIFYGCCNRQEKREDTRCGKSTMSVLTYTASF